MPKILLAIYDDILRGAYKKVFEEEKFEVLETNNGIKAIDLIFDKKPDIVLADVFLLGKNGFEILDILKVNKLDRKIPVLIFSEVGREAERIKAMELGARDFIVGSLTLPKELVAKVKIHLGFQKSYEILIDEKNLKVARELRVDMGYNPDFKCPRCGIPMVLFLIRDLSKGKDYFKISFSCPACGYTE
jgi:DNA-binding response OmpR family regulator